MLMVEGKRLPQKVGEGERSTGREEGCLASSRPSAA